MAEPPSYEESTSVTHPPLEQKGDQKTPQSWSIREQVGLSRTQHIASIVSQIGSHIRERALQGLSRTTLALILSDQVAKCKGVVVGFPDDDVPTLIRFEGCQNSTQFWLQEEALSELRVQLWYAVSDGTPMESTPALPQERTIAPPPPPPPPPPPKKTSWFGRKASKAPEPAREVQPAASPVNVDVRLDEVFFRSESEFGLPKTLGARVVMVTVDVR